MTVGQWLERTLHDLRNPSGRLRPSSNWQVYAALLSKLKTEGKVIDVPVCKVGDREFRQLGKWLSRRDGGRGFAPGMKVFSALIGRARKARLTRYSADYPWRDMAPRRKSPKSAKTLLSGGGNVRSLTREQWQAFVDMDLSEVKFGVGPKAAYWKEFYRDYCILLYELKSRPLDVLQLHHDSLAFHPAVGRWFLSYVPAKKRNNGGEAMQYLSPAALAIVEKYRGQSRGGYVLPFPMNGRRWNLDSPSAFREHYSRSRAALASVGRFFRAVGEKLEVPFPLTLYAVRRSALTHALIEGRIPLIALAKMAGTSVRMIEAHYTNFIHTLEAY